MTEETRIPQMVTITQKMRWIEAERRSSCIKTIEGPQENSVGMMAWTQQ